MLILGPTNLNPEPAVPSPKAQAPGRVRARRHAHSRSPSPPYRSSRFPAKRLHCGPALSVRDRRRHLHCRICHAVELAPPAGLIPSQVPRTFCLVVLGSSHVSVPAPNIIQHSTAPRRKLHAAIVTVAVAVAVSVMALVDYSSSDPDSGPESASASVPEPESELGPGHGRGHEQDHQAEPRHPATEATVSSALPPLPPSFHDLYASTVRTATADLPSLHQGRRRIIPHKDGNWPSHIYLEWHPSSSQHQLLQSLLTALARELDHLLTGHGLAGFLTSDLGAPLPLHVSLSRPFVLRTDEKDAFLDRLIQDAARCHVSVFALACDNLAWHRSPDSERSFLVLRVRGPSGTNDELSALLRACNRLVASCGQPQLYTPKDPGQQESNHASDAFHISLAWSFTAPTAELSRKTAEVFARPEFRDAILSRISIPVEGVKVKIGNVVTNIALPESRGGSRSRDGVGLFGI